MISLKTCIYRYIESKQIKQDNVAGSTKWIINNSEWLLLSKTVCGH